METCLHTTLRDVSKWWHTQSVPRAELDFIRSWTFGSAQLGGAGSGPGLMGLLRWEGLDWLDSTQVAEAGSGSGLP